MYPPGTSVSPGFGLPRERIGHSVVAAAPVVPIIGADGAMVGVAGGAELTAAPAAEPAHVDVTVMVVGTGVGVAAVFLAGVPTITGKVTAVCWPLIAEMA